MAGKLIGVHKYLCIFATDVLPLPCTHYDNLKRKLDMIENTTIENKPMHIAAYIGLCIVTWIAGAVVANGISILMGSLYAEATVPVIIGFWVGKIVLKNKHRDWESIIAFPIINLIAALLGSASSYAFTPLNPGNTALIILVISFALSCGLFALLNIKHSALGRALEVGATKSGKITYSSLIALGLALGVGVTVGLSVIIANNATDTANAHSTTPTISQGQYAQSESLYKRSLVIKEKTLGSDHPSVATSLNNLAETMSTPIEKIHNQPICEEQFESWVLMKSVASTCNLQPQITKFTTDYAINIKAQCGKILTKNKMDEIISEVLELMKEQYAVTIKEMGQEMGEKLFCGMLEKQILDVQSKNN